MKDKGIWILLIIIVCSISTVFAEQPNGVLVLQPGEKNYSISQTAENFSFSNIEIEIIRMENISRRGVQNE